MRTHRAVWVLVCAVGMIAPAAQAAPAWTLTGPSNANTPGLNVVGISFTVNESITVTDLGWYDNPLTDVGLEVSHDMAIYDATTRDMLASATVPSGTSGPVSENFYYVPVTPILLEPGNTYIVAGYTNAGDAPRNVTPGSSMFENSSLQTLAWVGEFTVNELEFPDVSVSPDTRQMGPNFLFVPEPGALALLGLGGLIVATRRRG